MGAFGADWSTLSNDEKIRRINAASRPTSMPADQAEAEAANYRADRGIPLSQESMPADQAETEAMLYRKERGMPDPLGGGTGDGIGLNKAPRALASMATGGAAPPQDSLFDRWSRSAADAFTAPGLLQAMRGEPRTERTPLQALSDKVDDVRNPLPDVSMPLPGMPPPAQVPKGVGPPSVKVGKAAHVDVPNTAVVQSADRGPLPADHPAVAKALEAARSNVKVAPDTAESDLDAALRQSNDRRLLAGLTRAGASAIGRGQGAAYDNLDEQADRPLAELQMRRQDAETGKARALAAQESDPASPQSQQARAFLSKMAPDLAKEPSFAGLTAARAKEVFPWAKELFDASSRKEVEALKIQGEIDKVKAKHAGGGGKGKTLPASEAAKAGDFEAAQASLDSLMKTRGQKTGPLSGLAQYLPGTDAAQYNDAALSTAQVVGYILEGGKLSDQDLPRYLRMLPTAGDSEERARAKVANIKQLLEQKRSHQLGALGAAGYNVRDVEGRGATSGPSRGLGRPPASEADISEMSDEELRAFVGGG